MSLVDWASTTATSKIKQCEIVARPGATKLKADGDNFKYWLEEQANHFETM